MARLTLPIEKGHEELVLELIQKWKDNISKVNDTISDNLIK